MNGIFFELLIMMPIFLGGITLIIIIIIPKMVKRRIPYCPDCKTGKFWFKPEEEGKIFNCKKCGAPMEWLEYPEDLFKTRVKYFRITFSLFYPTFLSLLLMGVTTSLFSIFLILTSMISLVILGIILDLKSRREILNWASKLE